ncbi:hypothetical protein HG536_0D03580 [Torulaspora globosa]|uniref:AP-2 complex subunit alpha n=1 Tax=Torulaspora globosa TaxID=48254 RepID=A0A7G3ZH50_9SACH|nr:uncharacterized protein HG536_0D03580 [Torulaspora globosa]QLL32836.1 hypothetical protein HG536_0D03580 [Torulaspora globosa]
MERRRTVLNSSTASNGNSIKGLQAFIADLRSSQHSQEHEKRIQSEIIKIKQNFESTSRKVGGGHDKVGGYQRKKYVAKLAYIYITSNTKKLNDILFGLDQMVELVQSNVYSEKFMAYMVLELLYEHPVVVSRVREKVTHFVMRDLASNDDNFVALALNFIGIVGKLDERLAFNDEVSLQVFQILRSPTSSQNLKKKSALAFLTLLKVNEGILTDDQQRMQSWIQRILSLLDDTNNYRMMLAVLPLVEFITRNINPTCCIRLLPQLSQILYNCVVLGTKERDSGFPEEFKFANVPNPWLIIRIVSLLNILLVSPTEARDSSSQFLHTSNIDHETLGRLRVCVTRAIELGTRQCNDSMERLVLNTVLFSLINFASKLDPSDEAISNSVTALCSLLSSADINTRYLTLDSLVKLCSLSGKPAVDTVRYKNLDLIFHLLNHEGDSSIVRKVVDLLYTFTDADNVQTIVDELFNFISSPRRSIDPLIKSEIAVKIAILTEKYASDTNWFIMVSLKLLSLASTASLNDDEIWQRLCQIVVNNPQLQKLTCEQLIDYLYKNNASESIVKAGAFLLGEYTDLIAVNFPTEDLFNLFTDKYFAVSNVTKAMILTTIVKLYRFNPKIESVVIKFFQLELNSLDIELQTRSYEYLSLVQLSKINGNTKLLDALFSPMPPFNTKTNPLLKRLGNLPLSVGTATLVDTMDASAYETAGQGGSADSMKPPPPPSRQTTSTEISGYIKNESDHYAAQMSSNWEEGFARMLSHKRGILYSSSMLKVLFLISTPDSRQPAQIKITLTFINQAEHEIMGFSTEIIPARVGDNPEYVLQNVQAPSVLRIEPHKRSEQSFEVLIRKPFSIDNSPIVKLYFSCGSLSSSVVLKAAIGLTATLSSDPNNTTSSAMTLAQFLSRWRTLREALGSNGEHTITNVELKRMTVSSANTMNAIGFATQTLKRMGFQLIDQPSYGNILFAAGIVHTKSDGNFGSLLKLKVDENTNGIDMTCKTTVPGPLAKYILECVQRAVTI